MRLDDSLLHQAGDLPQVVDVVFHAEIDGLHARLARRFLVDLADQGDEHPAALEHAPRARLGVSAQRVEHHVDVAQLLLEALALVVDDGIDADRFQETEARLARGSGDFGTLPARELRRERAHAAARPVDEEAHPGSGLGGIDDRLPRRERRHGERSRDLEVERGWLLDEVLHRHQRELREAAEHLAEHLVTLAQRGLRTGSDLLDDAREVLAERERHAVGAFRVVDVLAHHPVHRIHAGRADAHERLAARHLGQGDVLDVYLIGSPEFVDTYSFHDFLQAIRSDSTPRPR